MSLSGFNQLPIEYISFDNTIPLAVLILGICIQVSLHIIFDWETKIYSFFLGSERSSLQKKQSDSGHLKSFGVQQEKKSQGSKSLSPERKKKNDSDSICRGDVEVVFRSLGLLSSHPPQPQEREELARFEERLGCNDVLFDLFEEKEPSDDEVRAAFDVFDENKDGFIDARELQRLLCALGLREGSEPENCRRMIRAVDENGDDKIDFNEFVNFLGTVFC